MMLQQTQVATVLPYFARWMARFPHVRALAEAPLEDVLKAWEGLGYYARARNLQRAAALVLQRHAGRLPDDVAPLRALPGIGAYSAGAIASIAFNRPVPAVDGNVGRVLSRLVALPWPWRGREGQAALWALAAGLVPPRGARLFNQGLMELGALVCRDKAPACGRCPLRSHCAAFAAGEPLAWPLRESRRPRRAVRGVLAVLRARGSLLLRRCPEDGLWGGLYEFPWLARADGETPQAAAARLLGSLGEAQAAPGDTWALRHELTHLALELECRLYTIPARNGPTGRAGALLWVTPRELARLPLSRVGHKVLAHLDGMPGAQRQARPRPHPAVELP
ncbi:MAG: A/G-specific adenine glycosylase [Candidatus Lambdaproteobacteria bacterium]|nr:A/G-specific adenine glycosylase [Candidatus Lambdaproteobacteria bacterium]